MITFNELPDTIRKPGVYTEENTSVGLSGNPGPVSLLAIAQGLSSGSVAALDPVQVFTASEASAYFGSGSYLTLLCTAILGQNLNVSLTAIALDDLVAGVSALGALDVDGVATAAGTIVVWIGNQSVSVAVAKDDTATQVAAAINIALDTSQAPDLPLLCAVDGVDDTLLVLTAKHKGTVGNDIPVAIDLGEVSGLTIAITDMGSTTAGTGDPDIQTALDVVYGTPFGLIVSGLNDAVNLAALGDHLVDLAGPLEQRPGMGIFGQRGSVGQATTLATTLNAERISGVLLRGSKSLALELAGAYAGEIASASDPSIPLNGQQLADLAAPTIAQRLSRAEQETLLLNGITPLEVVSGERVAIVRAITTYVTNSSGTPDATLLDIATIRTLDEVRRQWRVRMESVFGPSSPASNRKLLTKNLEKIRAETLDVLTSMEEAEQLRDIDVYKDSVVVVESSAAAGRVDVSIPSPVVPGLHILAGKFNLVL